MDNVQSVVPEREALPDRHEERDHASVGDEIVERPVQIERGSYNGHIVFSHANCEGAGSSSDVQANAESSVHQGHDLFDCVIDGGGL